MFVRHEYRTGRDRRQESCLLPRFVERRWPRHDKRSYVVDESGLYPPEAVQPESYWEGLRKIPTRD